MGIKIKERKLGSVSPPTSHLTPPHQSLLSGPRAREPLSVFPLQPTSEALGEINWAPL